MRRVLSLCSVVVALAACAPKAPLPGMAVPTTGATVARLGDIEVTDDQVTAFLAQYPETDVQMLPPQARRELLTTIALETYLYENAIADGTHNDDEVRVQLAMLERQGLAEAWVRKFGEAKATDEAVRARYDEVVAADPRPEVRARHILVPTEAQAADLRAQIDGGADFAVLAKEHSVDFTSADRGGDLGWFAEGMMVGPFGEAAFSSKPGEVVGPVATRFGYHVILVEDKRDAVPFEDVSDAIRQALVDEAVGAELERLQSQVEIVQ